MAENLNTKRPLGKIIALALVGVAVCTALFLILRPNTPGVNATPTPGAIKTATLAPSLEETPAPTPSPVQSDIRITGSAPAEAEKYVKWLYELGVVFATADFASPAELPVSAAVQFAFCHLYYEVPVDMPRLDGPVFREALPQSITGSLTALFGPVEMDITQSDLYNKESGSFQMWEPKIGQPVFADVVFNKTETGYTADLTFYQNGERNTLRKKLQASLALQGEALVIYAIKAA